MAEPPRFASTPADVALMDQALAEADDDCLRLVDHLRSKGGDRARATAELVQGLLLEPRWDRLACACGWRPSPPWRTYTYQPLRAQHIAHVAALSQPSIEGDNHDAG